MELRHLRYFVAVASHGSFNRAAAILHLTQPPLSRQVKDLEEELRVRLFVRGRNSVKLTEAGELFYEEAREVLARADEAVRRVRGETTGETVRIGYAPSITEGIMSAALKKFQAGTPRVRIELTDLSSRELNEQAKAGQLDIVIAPAVAVRGIREFEWTELRQVQLVLVLPKTHPLAHLRRIPPARLRDLPLMSLGGSNYAEFVPALRRILKPFGVTPRFVFLVNDGVTTLFTAMQAGNAAAILTEGAKGTMPRTFLAKPFSPGLPSVSVVIGVPCGANNSYAETFKKLLLDEARRQDRRIDSGSRRTRSK